jgi:predicted amidohydrolase YtcJ
VDCTLRNVKVYQENNPRIADVTIAHGRIQQIESHAGRTGPDFDLQGSLVIPAFTDSHLHLHGIAASFLTVDLREADSMEESLVRIVNFSKGLQKGAWVTGGRWDRNRWPTISFPDRHALDRVLPDHPAQLWSRDGHALWLNTLGLEVLGISAETADPPGGVILREEDGTPTGILLEKAADQYAAKFSSLSPPNQLAKAYREAASLLNSLGIVACNHFAGEEDYPALKERVQQLSLPLHLSIWLDQATLPDLIEQGLQSGQGDGRVKFGGLKVFADGSLGSRTAWMLEPYQGSSDRGICAVDPDSLAWDIERAARNGIATAVHAIGDSAVRLALDCFFPTAALNEKLRSRIEHAQLVSISDIDRFLECGLLASVQPIHAPHDREMALRHWGDRAHRAYPYRSLEEAGTKLVFGSDAPVEDADPLPGLFAAVFRRLPGEPPEKSIGLREAISFEHALCAYTEGGAWGMYAETERGRLVPGQLADMVVMDRDFFEDPLSSLPQARVIATFLEGDPVYLAPDVPFCL